MQPYVPFPAPMVGSGTFMFSSLGRKVRDSIDRLSIIVLCDLLGPDAGYKRRKKMGRFGTNLRHPAARRTNPETRV